MKVLERSPRQGSLPWVTISLTLRHWGGRRQAFVNKRHLFKWTQKDGETPSTFGSFTVRECHFYITIYYSEHFLLFYILDASLVTKSFLGKQ